MLGENREKTTLNKGIKLLEQTVLSSESYYVRFYALRSLLDLKNDFQKREEKWNSLIQQSSLPEQITVLKNQLDDISFQRSKLENLLVDLRKKESSNELIKYLD